jgi:hypothetical protein
MVTPTAISAITMSLPMNMIALPRCRSAIG